MGIPSAPRIDCVQWLQAWPRPGVCVECTRVIPKRSLRSDSLIEGCFRWFQSWRESEWSREGAGRKMGRAGGEGDGKNVLSQSDVGRDVLVEAEMNRKFERHASEVVDKSSKLRSTRQASRSPQFIGPNKTSRSSQATRVRLSHSTTANSIRKQNRRYDSHTVYLRYLEGTCTYIYVHTYT